MSSLLFENTTKVENTNKTGFTLTSNQTYSFLIALPPVSLPILLNFNSESAADEIAKMKIEQLYCFDFDATLTTHTGNSLTYDENFFFKEGALGALLELAKERPFFITTNNVNDLRGFIQNNAQFKNMSAEDQKLLLERMVIVHKSSKQSTGGPKVPLITAILDLFVQKNQSAKLYFTDDQKDYCLGVLEMKDDRIQGQPIVYPQAQGKGKFVMPSEQNQQDRQVIERQTSVPSTPFNLDENSLLKRRMSRQPSTQSTPGAPPTPNTPIPNTLPFFPPTSFEIPPTSNKKTEEQKFSPKS